MEASLQKGDRVWAYKANKVPQLCLPCKREDGRANIYEPAKEGYILNCTLFFAEFKIRQNVLYIPLSQGGHGVGYKGGAGGLLGSTRLFFA